MAYFEEDAWDGGTRMVDDSVEFLPDTFKMLMDWIFIKVFKDKVWSTQGR